MDFHCEYVPDENNIWKKRFDHRGSSPYNEYSYDDIDRLAGVTYLDSDTESFVMDDLGNRTGPVAQRDGTHTYAPDPLTNRYTSIDAAALAYDPAGNLTTDKDGYLYTYDYENRITRIEKPDPQSGRTLVAAFDYDPQGRRAHDACPFEVCPAFIDSSFLTLERPHLIIASFYLCTLRPSYMYNPADQRKY